MASANMKKVYQEPKGRKKNYNEPKMGFIDRLSVKLLKKQDAYQEDKEHPPVTNIRRFFGYFLDFFFANLIAVIPLVIIQSKLTGKADATQDMAGLPLQWVYIITACVFLCYLFYYVYIPYKIWPGQTPAKRLLGYKIVMMDNSEVTLKALFLRNVVGLVFLEGAMFMTTYFIQLVTLTFGWEYNKYIGYGCYFLTILSIVITWTNYNRRMIHDFVGGTKVYKLNEKKETYSSF